MALLILAILILIIYILITVFVENRKRFWTRKNVPSEVLETPALSGGKKRKATFLVIQEQYKRNKSVGHKFFGTFFTMKPMFVTIDPDLIRNVLSKDFSNFIDRGIYFDEKKDPLSAQLFNLEGQKWRNLRAKLTPTFTSGKMKMMFPTLLDCAEPMMGRLETQFQRKDAIDIKEVLACFTTDVIGSCAFGLDCNSFASEEKDSDFRAAGKDFFGFNRLRMVRIMCIMFMPAVCKALGVRMFERRITDFYFNAVKDTIRYREDKGVSRNDFVQLLMELKHSGALTIGEIGAQSILFFLAGFETSSTLMHFCFYELTEHPEIQEKLREEILENIKANGGKLTYDGVMGMKYLGQVLEETLRKHPPVPNLIRKCVTDYRVPGTDITIDAGTRIEIPVYALHHDPEFYPEPEKFDPERFSDKNKAERHPYVYLPFGEGPRICIGLRFGMMQSRVGLSMILSKFRVKLHQRTETPIGISPTAFLMSSKNTIWLELEKL